MPHDLNLAGNLLARERALECQLDRQEPHGMIVFIAPAVTRVSHDRVADTGKVAADLVKPASFHLHHED